MTNLKNKLIDKNKQEAARATFSSYVQSVAFNMTLSRNMVDALWAVREWGSVWNYRNTEKHFVGTHCAPLMAALIRRGLVWHDFVDKAPSDHRYFKLTRAGELMCELLVEARLIEQSGEKEKRAKI